jgi:hypothetical protein
MWSRIGKAGAFVIAAAGVVASLQPVLGTLTGPQRWQMIGGAIAALLAGGWLVWTLIAEERAKIRRAVADAVKASDAEAAEERHRIVTDAHTVISGAQVELHQREISVMTERRASSRDPVAVPALRRLVADFQAELGDDAAREISTGEDPDSRGGVL